MPNRFTFRQLEYMVAVGDAGSIALASQRINVSSPSISAAISQLEDEFGIQLFVRHHAQGLSLTPGGRRIFDEARQILESAGALSDLAGDISQTARGPISIGTIITVAPLLTAAVGRSFQHAFPDANMTLREGNQIELLRMIGRGEIDVALSYDLEIPRDLEFVPLVSLPPYVMLPKGHALTEKDDLTIADLANEPMVLLDMPLSRDYFLSMFQMAGLRPTIGERTADLSFARSLVANGFGFSLINIRVQNTTAPDGKPLVFRPLVGDIRPMVLGLIMKQSGHRSRVVQAFCDHVKEAVKMGELPGVPAESQSPS
ncbi:LysR substrate-binding domain-containing protein [Alphaproteobacteria bacterium]|jgi:DNA-binding transcriptional LysR family regulator|nr:LysR substrate-binding domain-containing protein [Alphaproteobacteria bacterium]